MSQTALILVFVLLIALRVIVTRRLTASVLNKDERIQWFGLNRTLGQMSLAFWVAWLGIWWLFNPWEATFPLQIFRHRHNPAAVLALAFAPNFAIVVVPALVGLWCDLIVYPAVQALRNLGLTKREYVIDATFLRLWFPMAAALFWVGISVPRWTPSAAIYAAIFPGVGALWLILMPKLWVKLRGSEVYVPHSVTHGPLRDRAFAMAAKAGVELKQIYVYPLEKWKLANAWASQQNTLLLTDTLLKQLSRREVDAIIGHELAHMKSGHVKKQGWLFALLVFVPTVLINVYVHRGGGLRPFRRLESVALLLISAWQVIKIVRGWLSRRHEVQADTAGLALSGDGAPFISGLANIHRMNATPLEFKRLEEGFSTHPSTQRRFEAVAKSSNISDAELKQLIAEGLNDPERYPLPVGIAPEPGQEGLLFTSRVKQQAVASYTAAYFGSIAIPPAIWVSVSNALSPKVALAALPVFVLLYRWVIVAMLDRAGHRHVWKLRERLRKKLIPNAIAKTWFVGLAPHRELRLYEGAYMWDAGYLEICDGELRYVGEQTSFITRADEVRSIQLVSGAPRWRKTKVILIEWVDPETKQLSMFRLSCPGPSFSHDAKSAVKLFENLVAWKESNRGFDSSKRALKPIFPEITSTSPFASKRKNFFLAAIVVCSLPVAIALGIDDERRIWRAGMAMALALGGHVFAAMPFWRKPRVFAEKSWPAV